MKGGPEKVCRETCAHCQWQGMPEECADCPTKIAYDYIDERRHRIYYHEFGNTSRLFREMCDQKDAKRYKIHGRRKK